MGPNRAASSPPTSRSAAEVPGCRGRPGSAGRQLNRLLLECIQHMGDRQRRPRHRPRHRHTQRRHHPHRVHPQRLNRDPCTPPGCRINSSTFPIRNRHTSRWEATCQPGSAQPTRTSSKRCRHSHGTDRLESRPHASSADQWRWVGRGKVSFVAGDGTTQRASTDPQFRVIAGLRTPQAVGGRMLDIGPRDEAPAELARLLRQWRERALLTQEELAERSTLSVGTVSGLEAGRSRRPRGSSLRLLADALGLSDVERAALTAAVRAASPRAGRQPPGR